jgi:hypothetical protein
MKEKKQFYIPKNYQQGFEWIPGISGIEHLFFVPPVLASFVIFKFLDIDLDNKILTSVILLGIPYTLCAVKPIRNRENIPLYKTLYWKLRFLQRQRKFYYKKEGYVHVQSVQQETTETSTVKTTIKARGTRKEKHSRSYSYKGNKVRGTTYGG